MQLSWERCYSLVSFVYMMKISRWDRMQTVNTVWHGWTIEFLRETSVKSPAHQTIRLPWGHNSYHHAVHVDTCWLKGPTYRNAGKREQPLGKRFGVNTGYLLVGREDSWKVKYSGGTFRNSLGKFISLSLPCGQGNPFRLLPVYWAHPSYRYIYMCVCVM